MDDNELLKFKETPLGSDNYFFWSRDMEIILRGKVLWKYVGTNSNTLSYEKGMDENEHTCKDVPEKINKKERQKRGLTSAYIMISAG